MNKVDAGKMMIKQGIIYLYDAYREEGQTKEQAQASVLAHLDGIQLEYQKANVLPQQQKININAIQEKVHQMLISLQKANQQRKTAQTVMWEQNLHEIQQLLRGRS
jgi:hypothetical protein